MNTDTKCFESTSTIYMYILLMCKVVSIFIYYVIVYTVGSVHLYTYIYTL